MSNWKKIEYKEYSDNGETATAPVEEQLNEIMNAYKTNFVLVAGCNFYGYESVNVLLLEDYPFPSDREDFGDTFNQACILNNVLQNGIEYYMVVESPYKNIEKEA